MATLLKLKELGWNLSEEGLKKVSENGKFVDCRELAQKALDFDIKEIAGESVIADFIKSGKLFDCGANGIALQISNIRNVSAPKCNEASKVSPRLLQIDLTDGISHCSGLELEPITSISIDTPPGTKVILKGSIKCLQGMLILNPQNIKLLGGFVVALHEKWEANRLLLRFGKGFKPITGPGGPPPWIPFGKKIQNVIDDKTFKSINQEKSKEISKETADFNLTRTDAINEVLKLNKNRKVFGGGNRRLLDFNVKKIMDKGFTEEEAKYSLKLSRNNLERAMGNLKRRDDKNEIGGGRYEKSGGGGGGDRDRGFDRGGYAGRKGKMDMDVENLKPSAPISLFAYLENKIKVPETTTNSQTSYNESIKRAATTTTNTVSSKPHQNYDSHDRSKSSNYTKQQTIPSSSSTTPTTTSYKKDYRQQQDAYNNNQSSNRSSNSTAMGANSSQSKYQKYPNGGNSSSSSSGNRPVVVDTTEKSIISEQDRYKFQNNISASFASRNKKDDENNYSKSSNYSKWNDNKSGNFTNRYSSAPPNNNLPSNAPLHLRHNYDTSHKNATDSTKSSKVSTNQSSIGTSASNATAAVVTGGGTTTTTPTTTTTTTTNSSSNDSKSNYRNNSAQHPLISGNLTGTSTNYNQTSRYGRGGSHVNPYDRSQHEKANNNASNYQLTSKQRSGYNNSSAASTTAGAATTVTSSSSSAANPKLNNLIESTANMKISNASSSSSGGHSYYNQPGPPSQQYPKQHQQPYHHHHQHQHPASNMHRTPPPPSTTPSQQQQQQQPMNKQNAQFDEVLSLPNGFSYNPHKIMGFQNKETNEVALKVLKTQNYDNQKSQPPSSSSQQQQQQRQPSPQSQISNHNQNVSTIPPPKQHQTSHQPYQQQTPPPPIPLQQQQQQPYQHQTPPPQMIQTIPTSPESQPSAYIAMPTHSIAQIYHTQTGLVATPQGMHPHHHHPHIHQAYIPNLNIQPHPQQFNWNWKIGDRCMAKYWEDGRYYDAKITGISEATCVVNFLEYGNFEEVLQSDCIPYTNEISPQNITHYNGTLLQQSGIPGQQTQSTTPTGPPPSLPQQQPPPIIHYMQHQQQPPPQTIPHNSSTQPQRYNNRSSTGDRPIYIPVAQRTNHNNNNNHHH